MARMIGVRRRWKFVSKGESNVDFTWKMTTASQQMPWNLSLRKFPGEKITLLTHGLIGRPCRAPDSLRNFRPRRE